MPVAQVVQQLSSPQPPTTEAEAEAASFQAFVHANREYINLSKGLERALFMIGFAVILSAIIEAKSPVGLTPYHALVVLNISQINNWAGFLLLLMRGGFRPSEQGGWSTHFLVTRDSLVSSIPGMVHALMMSGLGLYFWSNLGAFLQYAKTAEQPCQPMTYYWLFGAVDVSSKALQIASLVFYGIGSIPIFSLYFLGAILAVTMLAFMVAFTALVFVICLATFVFMMLYYILVYPIVTLVLRPLFRMGFLQDILASISGILAFIDRGLRSIRRTLRSYTTALLVGPSYSQLFTFPVAIVVCGPLIYTIISTELTIHINSPNVEPGAENKWTYGQTLALFSTLVSIVLYGHELGKMMRKRRKELLRGRDTGAPVAVEHRTIVKTLRRPVFVERDTQTDDSDLGFITPH
ncbi:hypothetical protein DXG03_006791 [Asterophora parasitica]|uniref:Uncharacterized protein n=1 Tax=Asterophora parasitica TaxID=117018 RepID=A0A9P7G6V4_9AGAR|nr:hypothetical protein DXG03_006791 [Asterophora parasitica]